MLTAAAQHKKKMHKAEVIKINNFCTSKEIIKRMKRVKKILKLRTQITQLKNGQ